MKARWTVLLIATAGCASTTSDEDSWQRRLGVIDPAISAVQLIQVPPVIRAGVPFTVVVHTLGSSSCTRVSGTEVDVGGLEATIQPYDLYAPRDRACTDDLHGFPHQVTITFDAPGTATLRVRGRNHAGQPASAEIEVPVLPASGSAWVRQVGVVDPALSSVPMIELPTRIHAGEPFQAIVNTLGSSSCTVPDGVQLTPGHGTADITPYDRYATQATCTADLAPHPHPVTISFGAVGQARIRVHGRDHRGQRVTHSLTVAVRRP